MKKLVLTLAIVLGVGMASFAQNGGLFQRGETPQQTYFFREDGVTPPLLLPGEHNLYGNQSAPLGSGIALLTAIGAAYLVGKKRREE